MKTALKKYLAAALISAVTAVSAFPAFAASKPAYSADPLLYGWDFGLASPSDWGAGIFPGGFEIPELPGTAGGAGIFDEAHAFCHRGYLRLTY